MTTPGVDFFRIDRSGATSRLLVVAGFLVTCGATAVGAHLVRRLPESVSRLISLVGAAAVLGGLVLAFGSLAMMMFENIYLAIRDDGLLVHQDGKEITIAWGELTAVEVDAPKGLVELHRSGEEVLRWHAGKAAKDVAARIEEAKRKAAHGLLRTGSTPPTPPPS